MMRVKVTVFLLRTTTKGKHIQGNLVLLIKAVIMAHVLMVFAMETVY
jgi:hypothetical protein